MHLYCSGNVPIWKPVVEIDEGAGLAQHGDLHVQLQEIRIVQGCIGQLAEEVGPEGHRDDRR